jgi:hypothetical protein
MEDCFEKSQTIVAQVTAQLNIHRADLVSTKKLSDVSFTIPFRGRTEIFKLLITEGNAQMRQRWCHDHKPGHQTTGNACVMWSDESSFTLFPTAGRVCVWRTTKEP